MFKEENDLSMSLGLPAVTIAFFLFIELRNIPINYPQRSLRYIAVVIYFDEF